MTEKIFPSSSWNYKPLPKQIRAITRMETQLHIPEGIYPETRLAARNRIHWLRDQLRRKNNVQQ